MIDQHVNHIQLINVKDEMAAVSLYIVNQFREPNNNWMSRAGGREIFQLVTENQNIRVFRVYHRNYELEISSQVMFIMIEILRHEHSIAVLQSCDLLIHDMICRGLNKEEILAEFLENVGRKSR